ncbi:MAG: hypothetical protein L0G89_00400 [Janibacter sp.]|nr:hypothetical protein [Janibacter sp.]
MTVDMHQLDEAITGQLSRIRNASIRYARLSSPTSLLAALQTATSELREVAAQYGAAMITRETFLTQRARPAFIVQECATELNRHLRDQVLLRYPDAAPAIESLTISRQRVIIDALVSRLVVRPRHFARGFDSRIEVLASV